MAISRYKTWTAWEKAFKLSSSISRMARMFPQHERYSLTDQVRRSSRSVCANLAEAAAKNKYPKHWRSKLTDCMGENYETQTWLAFALAEEYISKEHHDAYVNASQEVGKLLQYMYRHPEKFK